MTLSQRAVEAAARAIAETRGAIWTRPDHTVSATFDHDAAKAALSAALAVDGLCLVPKEPTWAMQIAGRDAILAEDDDLDLSTDDARAAYKAMLAAASTGDSTRQTEG